ncbi:MAG: WbqC family protein [Bacteroidota bacterium]
MQPTYLPWLGFFDLIRKADVFVIYDHVQFEKQSWQQRNRIRNRDGELMLTMSVRHGEGLERQIKDVKIDYQRNIVNKHLNSIRQSYSKSRNFALLYPSIEAIYQKQHENLIDLNIALIKFGMAQLSIKKDFIYSSAIDVQSTKVEALIDICNKTGCTEYYSPVGSKQYIDENNLFDQENIALSYQQFNHPAYTQINYADFISHLSFIDYLFNVEIDEAKNFGLHKTGY